MWGSTIELSFQQQASNVDDFIDMIDTWKNNIRADATR